MFSFLLKPRPYPAFVLIAVIIGIGGAVLLRSSRFLGFGALLIAGVLVALFVRSLVIDLSVDRVGIKTTARVTRVERKAGKANGQADEVVWVYFAFADAVGATHNEVMVLEGSEDSKLTAGDSVRIRYHPNYPDVWRWLE